MYRPFLSLINLSRTSQAILSLNFKSSRKFEAQTHLKGPKPIENTSPMMSWKYDGYWSLFVHTECSLFSIISVPSTIQIIILIRLAQWASIHPFSEHFERGKFEFCVEAWTTERQKNSPPYNHVYQSFKLSRNKAGSIPYQQTLKVLSSLALGARISAPAR